MTANGNEAVTLSQLKMFTESSNSGGIGYTDPGIVGFATGDEVVTLKQLKMLRDSRPHSVIVTVYSKYAPFPSFGRSGIYFTDTNGQIQTAHIEEIGEQISFSAMPGSMVLLASSYDIDAKVSGNAELAIDGMVEMYYDGHMASLVFVYGKCEIHC